MKTMWVGILAAALSSSALAQESKGGQEKVAFEQRALPFEGEVTAENLNVRMFPKSDQTSIITSVLKAGEKVVVVGEKEDFYQIQPPKGSLVWIFGRNVKKDGAVGTVAGEAPVRMDSRVSADVLCTLKDGEQVKIVGEHMGWYKIEAPMAVKYFVGKKYVRPGAAVATVAAKGDAKKSAPAADVDGPIRTRIAEVDARVAEQKKLIDAGRLGEVDFTGVVEAYKSAIASAKGEGVRSDAEAGLRRAQEIQIRWLEYKSKVQELEAKVAAERLKIQAPPPAPVKQFVMQGYVDTVGLIVNRPGTHKLVQGGKIVCFLRVKDGDDRMPGRLNDHYQKFVGVTGTVIKNPEGWDGYTVVVVDEVTPIQQ